MPDFLAQLKAASGAEAVNTVRAAAWNSIAHIGDQVTIRSLPKMQRLVRGRLFAEACSHDGQKPTARVDHPAFRGQVLAVQIDALDLQPAPDATKLLLQRREQELAHAELTKGFENGR